MRGRFRLRFPARSISTWTKTAKGVAGADRPLPKPFPLYSQPGKHAFAPSPEWFTPHEAYAAPCTRWAGYAGLLVTPLFHGLIHKQEGDDEAVAGYLQACAFEPSFSFEKRWQVSQEMLVPWPELKTWIPRRISEMRALLRSDRAT